MKIGAAYIRVSTDDQLEYSPDAQLREIKKAAAAGGILIPPEFIFLDQGISGRNAKKRPAFNEMIGRAKTRPRPFDVILIWKFSRFARNQEESIVYKSMLKKEGIDVVSVSEPLVDGPFGSLIERIIEWMDEYYSIRLSGEVTRGMTEKASRGEFQSTPPLGYTMGQGKSLVAVEAEAKYIHFIFRQYLSGASPFAIAAQLNTMGCRTKRGNRMESRTVEYILNNPVYKGYTRWTPHGKTVGKRIYDSPATIVKKSEHAPLVEEAVFDAAVKRFLHEKSLCKKGRRPPDGKKHYLSGVLTCGSCGSSLTYAAKTGGFQCVKYSHGSCRPSHYISAVKIEAAILLKLDELCRPGAYIERGREAGPRSDEREILSRELAEAEKMLGRAKQGFLCSVDTIEEYEENKKGIQANAVKIQAALAALPPPPGASQSHRNAPLLSIRELLQATAISDAQKQRAIRAGIERIDFCRPENVVQIYLKDEFPIST